MHRIDQLADDADCLPEDPSDGEDEEEERQNVPRFSLDLVIT